MPWKAVNDKFVLFMTKNRIVIADIDALDEATKHVVKSHDPNWGIIAVRAASNKIDIKAISSLFYIKEDSSHNKWRNSITSLADYVLMRITETLYEKAAGTDPMEKPTTDVQDAIHAFCRSVITYQLFHDTLTAVVKQDGWMKK